MCYSSVCGRARTFVLTCFALFCFGLVCFALLWFALFWFGLVWFACFKYLCSLSCVDVVVVWGGELFCFWLRWLLLLFYSVYLVVS